MLYPLELRARFFVPPERVLARAEHGFSFGPPHVAP